MMQQQRRRRFFFEREKNQPTIKINTYHNNINILILSSPYFFDSVNMKTTILAVLAIVATSSVEAFAPSSQTFSLASTSSSSSSSSLFSTVDDKTEVREYFNSEGFNRWNKIYSESDDVNSVQMDIRTGHDQTIQKILNWIKDDGDIEGKSVCDCGCGVGSLAIPLASMGKYNYYHY